MVAAADDGTGARHQHAALGDLLLWPDAAPGGERLGDQFRKFWHDHELSNRGRERRARGHPCEPERADECARRRNRHELYDGGGKLQRAAAAVIFVLADNS